MGDNMKTLTTDFLAPADNNCDDTNLRFANHDINTTNQQHVNEDLKEKILREYQEEIKKLKSQLEAIRQSTSVTGN